MVPMEQQYIHILVQKQTVCVKVEDVKFFVYFIFSLKSIEPISRAHIEHIIHSQIYIFIYQIVLYRNNTTTYILNLFAL